MPENISENMPNRVPKDMPKLYTGLVVSTPLKNISQLG